VYILRIKHLEALLGALLLSDGPIAWWLEPEMEKGKNTESSDISLNRSYFCRSSNGVTTSDHRKNSSSNCSGKYNLTSSKEGDIVDHKENCTDSA